MTAPALETVGLLKRFGGVTATDQVSLAVAPGELHALIGPNGAGKSTLIGQLAGELSPDAGDIRLFGQSIIGRPVHERARLGLGRTYQVTQLAQEFTVLDNVLLAVNARRGGNARFLRPALHDREAVARAHAVLEQVGLANRADALVTALAHGEQRQLEIAMALATEPRLLLLDEPLAGMSQGEAQAMVALLHELKGRYPMLLVEHDMEAVFALADRVSVLVYGRIIASGTVAEIRANVQAAYLGEETTA
ncbi:MAG: ABC transporter ATP-binding protein [Casimicrobiaceae bacterium]